MTQVLAFLLVEKPSHQLYHKNISHPTRQMKNRFVVHPVNKFLDSISFRPSDIRPKQNHVHRR